MKAERCTGAPGIEEDDDVLILQFVTAQSLVVIAHQMSLHEQLVLADDGVGWRTHRHL